MFPKVRSKTVFLEATDLVKQTTRQPNKQPNKGVDSVDVLLMRTEAKGYADATSPSSYTISGSICSVEEGGFVYCCYPGRLRGEGSNCFV